MPKPRAHQPLTATAPATAAVRRGAAPRGAGAAGSAGKPGKPGKPGKAGQAPARKPAAAGPAGATGMSAAAGPTAPTGPTGSTQRIVAAITTAIVERRLMPGTKLSEQKIADIFAVSRTLVRQALNQLSRDRLVVLTPARGACVATPSVDEARQVFQVRQILEAALARELCAVITDAQVAELRAHLRAEADAVARADVPARTRLLAEFHTLLARMVGNQVLAQLLGDLLTRSSLIALMYQSTHSAEASLAEHVAIVDAFERRDAKAAVRLSVEHLAHVEQNMQLRPQGPDLAQILKVPAP